MVALVACIAVGVPCARPAAADEVAAYLERHGLVELLSVHLEDRLETATGDEREDILIRLAGIYAELLESVEDPIRRVDLSERCSRLLAEAPKDGTGALRLALLRASYRSAERTAENHRLRLATEPEIDRARAALTELIPDLNDLRKQLAADVDRTERRRGRATGTDAVVLTEEAEKARRLLSECTFLTAWALYYQSWLNERPDNARSAERLFLEILDFGDEAPFPENVSVDLRGSEAIARCILGVALCKSLTSSTASAESWLALLEHERSFEPLREQVPAWRLVLLLEAGEFLRAQALLDGLRADGVDVPLPWWRLAAVHAIEAAPQSRYAAALASAAVTELAARGELEQVFDLAERYGVDALGASGFALRYVGGVVAYYEAREAHGLDRPAVGASERDRYRLARIELEAALGERDAGAYPGGRADCMRLIAWCLYFEGEYRLARSAFERAAESLSAEAAPEALWMAIVCLDRLVEADGHETGLDDELAALVARFLEAYPASEHAPKLLLRRALTSDEVSPEVVEDLLSIPVNSDVYPAARRRAAQVLYRLFRDTSGVDRVAFGSRYLLVAVPLFVADRDDLDAADAVTLARFVVRGRRILEVALNEGIARLVAAREVLAAFDTLREPSATVETLSAALSEIDGELTYRRLQERLESGDAEAAGRAADELWGRGGQVIWARLAARAMFRHADARWRDLEVVGGDDRAAVALVVKYGSRVLEEFADEPRALDDRVVLGYHAAVAEASMVIWDRSGDRRRGETALALYERLLAALPRNASFLRATALLSERLDRVDQAITCWRTLVAGSGQGSEAWYEAKFHLISLLAVTDPSRAVSVMEQHRALNPEYGPDPWGARLRALDRRLSAPAAGESGSSAEREEDAS